MLTYQFDSSTLSIQESKVEGDYEFRIHVQEEEQHQAMRDIRHYFAENRVHTDVLFYTQIDHGYQVIVRQDYYVAFVLQLFAYRLLTQVAWKDN
ncbi:hypothetical protein EDM56_05840 [Brevibacillus fluminis]|uniref:Uncharacterized protein n=1 Tax=Brevibacillus fluminis TaxID=511487 RepID=A0A3M8DSG4_9BACL|nr:hypothetical protein [Brevibacillus fluminis]RNB91106.1 hypothetical protein EDM56_05840 [Brevibacillus fluminis]